MAERRCAFTGRKARTKLRFPENDDQTWIEVPCCPLYFKLRKGHPKLTRHEKELAMMFIESEMIKAGLYKQELMGLSDQELERVASWQEANRLHVEHLAAGIQKEENATVEANLEAINVERLEALDEE